MGRAAMCVAAFNHLTAAVSLANYGGSGAALFFSRICANIAPANYR